MTQALTSTQLAQIRSENQRTRLFLGIYQPSTVYTALVNGAPTSNDGVAQITYDGGSGALGDVLAGMTLYVGTTSGAYDLGMVRIRKTPTGTIFYIGETSEISWADNAYLTVVDEFDLWVRQVYIGESGVAMDYDIEYDDQHTLMNPVPVLGPPAAAWLTGASVDVEFDASDSWILGSTISSYSWSAPDSLAISGGSTATPTISYNAAGSYRVSCTVTAANGKSTVGHRHVMVFDDNNPPVTQFVLEQCNGDAQVGGWNFRVRLFDEAARSEIKDRSLVVLFARDWYGSTEAGIGPVDDRENIVTVGHINGGSIEWEPDRNNVIFDVQGPHFALQQLPSFPIGIEDTDLADVAASWTAIPDLTVDKALFHLIHWRATISTVMDVYRSEDTRQVASMEATHGSLWIAMVQMAYNAILARPLCDRLGRMYVEIDINHAPVADRSGFPVVQAVAENDWQPPLAIQRRESNVMSQISISGVLYDDGEAEAICTRSPGEVFARHGNIERFDSLAFASVADAVELAGLMAAAKNNEYPSIEITTGGNQRMTDICPRQYLSLTIAEGDTERGIVWSSKKLIPRRINYVHDPNSGVLTVSWTAEAETGQWNAVQYTCPGLPGITPIELPEIPTPGFPPFPGPLSTIPNFMVLTFDFYENAHLRYEGRYRLFYTDSITALNPVWEEMSLAGLHAYIGYANPDGNEPGAIRNITGYLNGNTPVLYAAQGYIGGNYQNDIFKKTGSGAWASVRSSLDERYYGMALNPDTPNIILVLAGYGLYGSYPYRKSILRSSDGGSNWSEAHARTLTDYRLPTITGSFDGFKLSYNAAGDAVITFREDHISINAANRILWETANDGTTVTETVTATTKDNNKVYTHGPDGETDLLKSAIANYDQQPFSIDLYGSEALDALGWGVVTPSDYLKQSSNGGSSWSAATGPNHTDPNEDQPVMTAVKALGATGSWLVGGVGGLWKTTDFGTNWTRILNYTPTYGNGWAVVQIITL